MFVSYVCAKYIWLSMVFTNGNLGLASSIKKGFNFNCIKTKDMFGWEEFGEGKGGIFFQF